MSESALPSSQCPACDSQAVDFLDDIDASVCSDCGYVLQDPETESGDGSDIDIDVGEDTSDDTVPSNWQERISVKDKSEANLVDVLELAEAIIDALSLSDEIATHTAEIVTEAWETNFMHGRTKVATVGAALYVATRDSESTVPPGAIADQVDVDKTRLKTTYRQLKSSQQLELAPPTPQDYVGYLCEAMTLSNETANTARELLDGSGAPSGNPVGIAAAAVYEATENSDTDRSLREVASEARLTKETVWRHAVELRAD